MRIGVVVTAAGSGERLGAKAPKALVTVAGRSLLSHAIDAAWSVADLVVVTAPAQHLAEFGAVIDAFREGGPGEESSSHTFIEGDGRNDATRGQAITVVPGGATRQDSVRAGIAALGDVDVVLVHDAARAFAPASLFRDVVTALEAGHGAVIPALAVVDTIKRADAALRVRETVDRSELWAVQTPQGFRRELLARAHTAGAGNAATDDAALVEELGEAVQLIRGHEDAFKITTPRDLAIARALLAVLED